MAALARAARLLRQRQYRPAEDALRPVLAADPDNTLALALLALAREGQQRPPDAQAPLLAPSPAQTAIRAAVAEHDPILRPILRVLAWRDRIAQSRRGGWALLIGICLTLVADYLLMLLPSLQPVGEPIVRAAKTAFFAVLLLFWLTPPLGNLALQLDRFGRLALTPLQRAAAFWLPGCLLAGVALLAASAATRVEPAHQGLLFAGVEWLALALGTRLIWEQRRPKRRRTMLVAAGWLAVLTALELAGRLAGVDQIDALTMLFAFGWISLLFYGAFSLGPGEQEPERSSPDRRPEHTAYIPSHDASGQRAPIRESAPVTRRGVEVNQKLKTLGLALLYGLGLLGCDMTAARMITVGWKGWVTIQSIPTRPAYSTIMTTTLLFSGVAAILGVSGLLVVNAVVWMGWKKLFPGEGKAVRLVFWGFSLCFALAALVATWKGVASL